MEMDDTQIMLARHNQQLKILEKDIDDLKAVQSEIRTMNETLVLLATELKHTNEHLARHEEKINTIESILTYDLLISDDDINRWEFNILE